MSGKKIGRRNPVALFFKILISIVLAFILLASCGIYAYDKFLRGSDGSLNGLSESNGVSLMDSLFKKSLKMNVAVFGTDADGTRTDVIFVLHYDSKQKSIGMLSVPRDTYVEITPEITEMMEEEGRSYLSPCKINAVHAYGGKDGNGSKYAVMQLEDILGIDIDHYVKIDLVAFKEIVDAIGGVDVVVPEGIYHYDPDPDLNIDLRDKTGEQHLNGAEALQLVRYRGYPQADIQRVSTQQDFLKAMAKKILNTDSILKNIPEYIEIAMKYVKTDVPLSDAIKYSNYISEIDLDKITMETLPGVAQNINGPSYYILDKSGTALLVDKIFYETGSDDDSNSKKYEIEVANGSTTEGLAAKTRDRLLDEGYNISKISTYAGEKEDVTRIVTSSKDIGTDLIKYFNEAEVVVNKNLIPSGSEIYIILGMSEN
ncbi:MAG: LCP family protein [Lachnospiraceae bacterium]|nr:LCP family protein [Lachnospiraceae bacterium]